MKKERLYYLDFLKVIGLMCLFLAHANAPQYLQQIRNFDVPLMIFISMILARQSYQRCNDVKTYYSKRICRLVFPTWIFLCMFWLCMSIIGKFPGVLTIIKSFVFQRDSGLAGYVWVIWIYIICALVTPILTKIRLTSKNIWLYILIWLIYEILASQHNLIENRGMYYTFFSVIPYSLFALLVVNYDEFSKKQKLVVISSIVLMFSIFAISLGVINRRWIQTSEYKYPARLYYFCYAFPICVALYETCKKRTSNLFMNPLISFVSRNTLWIYLWHIIYVSMFTYFIVLNNWILRWLATMICSVVTVYVQVICVNKIQSKTNWKICNLMRG